MRPIVRPPRVSSGQSPGQGLRLHRPRSTVRARAAEPVRVSDLILAVLGVSLLGAVAMFAGLSIFVPGP